MQTLLKIILCFLHWFRGLFHYGKIPYINCDECYINKRGERVYKNKKLVSIAQSICWNTEQLYRFLSCYKK